MVTLARERGNFALKVPKAGSSAFFALLQNSIPLELGADVDFTELTTII